MEQQERQEEPEDDVLRRDCDPAQNLVPTAMPGSKRKWVAWSGPGLVASSTAAPGESCTGPMSTAAAIPSPPDRTGDHCRTVWVVSSPTITLCQARIQSARRKGEAVTAKIGLI